MVEINVEPRHIKYTSGGWHNNPPEEIDFWTVEYKGRSYDAKTPEKALDKARRDPRNDPYSIKRITHDIAYMRTLYGQALNIQRNLKYVKDDIEYDFMVKAVDECVKLLEPWRRQ